MRALESFKWFKLVLSHFLIKTWCFASYGSFAYKYILSISGWWLIRLNNEFVFFRSRASSYFYFVWMIKIGGQYGLYSFVSSSITSSKLSVFCIVSLYCYLQSLLFHLLDLCLFNMHTFLSKQLITFFCHHLNLKQSY